MGLYILTANSTSGEQRPWSGFEASGDAEAKVQAGRMIREAIDNSVLSSQNELRLTAENDRTVFDGLAARFLSFGQHPAA